MNTSNNIVTGLRVGSLISEGLERMQLTSEELAVRVEHCYGSVWGWATGRTIPRGEARKVLCDVLLIDERLMERAYHMDRDIRRRKQSAARLKKQESDEFVELVEVKSKKSTKGTSADDALLLLLEICSSIAVLAPYQQEVVKSVISRVGDFSRTQCKYVDIISAAMSCHLPSSGQTTFKTGFQGTEPCQVETTSENYDYDSCHSILG